jgi:hypothetical protein
MPPSTRRRKDRPERKVMALVFNERADATAHTTRCQGVFEGRPAALSAATTFTNSVSVTNFAGDHSDGETPDPIPNSAVKPVTPMIVPRRVRK